MANTVQAMRSVFWEAICLVASLMLFGSSASLADGVDPLHGPPLRWDLGDETWISPIVTYDALAVAFSGNRETLRDHAKGQLNELGFRIQKADTFDLDIYYSLWGKRWRNVYLKLSSSAVLPVDIGSLRLGQGKIPLGFERNTSSTQTSFIESSAVSQAIYERRRIGLQWSLLRTHWLVDAGVYGNNLEGTSPGHTWAWHAAWIPIHTPGQTLHLGVARSEEYPRPSAAAAGPSDTPITQFKVAPSVLTTTATLIGSGALVDTSSIQRTGLEGLWIDGPFSLQAEYLGARATFDSGRQRYNINGHYVFASWVLTGESRRYAEGNVFNVVPECTAGALELVARYSVTNLDDKAILGGREHDWTGGVNWYLGSRLRLQINYTQSLSHRRDKSTKPQIMEFHAQLAI